MIKRESKFALRFRHWLKANPLGYSATFELKDFSHKKSFPMRELKEAQRNWALAISEGDGVLMRNMGGNGEPDYTYHFNEPAYIVINFREGFCIITIQALMAHTRKSLTFSEAQSIATITVN